jgi:glycosyltransferase involved in cell wall biosynthesis
MKIAIISSGFLPVIDGVTVTLINRLQKLSEYKHQVLLFCPDYSGVEKIYPDWKDYTGNILPGIKVINLASDSLLSLDFERNVTSASYQTVWQELEKFQPDLIHVDEPERLFCGFLRRPGIDFARRNQIPCVSFFHTNFLEYGKDYFNTPVWLDKIIRAILNLPLAWIYNGYDVTLVSSQITAQKLSKLGIKNVLQGEFLGVDLNKFVEKIPDRTFWETQKVKLIFLSRLTPDKGWKFAIAALDKMAKEIDLSHISLTIAGDGAMRDEIAKSLEKIGLDVHFLGRISPDAVPSLLANGDIFVTTSEKETRGLTVLEAFAAGIPAIAPRAGGVIDSIQEGWNGFLYEPHNWEDFIDKLKLLIENSTLRETMGKRGKESIVNYSWDNAVKNLLKIWQEQMLD